MRKKDVHIARYFAAKDFEGPLTLTIETARLEKFANGRGDEIEKLVIYFEKTKSGYVIGVTVWDMIADITGTDETDKWPGHQLKLVREMTSFGGKRVPCIRPYAPDDAPAKKTAKPKKDKQAEEPPAGMDDDIPF